MKKEVYVNILLSLATCFMFFIYAPLELLFTNQDEFWYDVWLLFPVMFIVFAVFFGISTLLLNVILGKKENLYHKIIIFYFIAFICSYIQGTFLAGNLPRLDGTAIDWSQFPMERIKTILVWVIVTALVLALLKFIRMKKMLKVIQYASAFAFAVLFVSLISVGIIEDGFKHKPNMTICTANQFEMSQDTNFIILVLDALDAGGWNEVYEKHPEYREVLEDFTFYEDAMGTYSFTKHSIPFMLSGKWHENEGPFREYSTDAYMNSPLFASLQEKSYKMGLYEQDVILDDEGFYMFDNIFSNKGGAESWSSFIRWQIQMTGFKYAPFDFKRICFVNPEAFKKLRIPPENEQVFIDSNVVFYDSVLHEDITLIPEKCFKFIHIEGAHLPFRYDENVNVISNGTYESNVEACMTITKAYLEKLKESGVYDNSVIMIMADHGFCYQDTNDTLHRQNPVLFIKGVGEKHDFQVSDAPVSWEDLQDIYSRLLNGADSMSVVDYTENDKRKRRYLHYEYREDDCMREYIQEGKARNEDTFKPTGNIYILE